MTQIATLLSNLLAHYWIESEHPAVRRQIITDWIEDLVEFGPALVEKACREWRQTQRRRPAIADVRRLCIEAQRQHSERQAIADQRPGALDEDTLKMWAGAEYHGDFRTPVQRRQAAIDAQEERYRRAAAYRAGKLDEYDAVHHPERLAERRRAMAANEAQRLASSLPECPISRVLDELGVTSKAAE